MADIALHIDDSLTRMTLKAMLEGEGHRIVDAAPGIVFADTPSLAIEHARACPALLLATAGEVPNAVAAMRQGVFGYVFLPLQPGEAGIMVQRILDLGNTGKAPSKTDGEMLNLEEVERRHILDTLRKCKNNRAKAACLLGIGRNTLWRKLKRIQDAGGGD